MNMTVSRHSLTKDHWAPFLFILPFIVSWLVFFLFPSIYSFVLSFFAYKGYGVAKFIGFRNYVNLINYPTLWRTLLNTIIYFVLHFAPTMVISFLLAVMVKSKLVRRYQKIYKPIIFIPQICAIVASSLAFKVIFGGNVGVINQLFGTEIPFLTDTSYMRYAVVALMIWRAVGWFFIIYLSGLTTIDDEIEEAARIDGASPVQFLLRVTIPLMKPIFMFAFITNAISSFKLFTEPNLLLGTDNVAPMTVAPYVNIISSNIQGGNFGMASAAGWILFLIILILTLMQFKLFKRGNEQ